MSAQGNGIELRSPWHEFSPETAAEIPVSVGVYEIGDSQGKLLIRGCAGGQSVFGLRGEVAAAAAHLQTPFRYRVEVTMSYMSRLKELTTMLPVEEGAGHGPGVD